MAPWSQKGGVQLKARFITWKSWVSWVSRMVGKSTKRGVISTPTSRHHCWMAASIAWYSLTPAMESHSTWNF